LFSTSCEVSVGVDSRGVRALLALQSGNEQERIRAAQGGRSRGQAGRTEGEDAGEQSGRRAIAGRRGWKLRLTMNNNISIGLSSNDFTE
jgi:hypothetical protein